MENLEKSGCGIRKNFIKATNCIQECSGGFSRGTEIVVCYNHLKFQDQVDQTMIHDIIHAYDDRHGANLNWNNCGQACSEVIIFQTNASIAMLLNFKYDFTMF
ncbi:mitochondrial inner membrane protease ATP23-like isoform X1 [Salvia divinorum]|uniref:Mitochondrial inner membrane protease ATP23 n=1 Tax=Salvia divinorum TaxID=28513 RepID=A0ABD1GZQ1_SALDI